MATRVLEGVVGCPAPSVRRYVDRYRGYRQEGFDPGVHHGLPSRYLTLIIAIEDPVDIVEMPGHRQSPGAFDAFVSGLHSSPALIRHDGHQRGVHLDVTPLGARALLGMPAGEIAETVIDLRETLGSGASELVDRLNAARTWVERFAAIDAVFSRAAVDDAVPQPEVSWAWERILETGGTVEVRELAAEVGWSRRHLGARFREEIGLSPKTASRVVRFERARRVLASPNRPGLAELAATCGFYDQAHLTREWRDLAGCTPTAWLAEEGELVDLPSVQDETEVVVA